MTGDNTIAMKIGRAYTRLLVSILNKSPEWITNYYFAEAQGWAAPRILTIDEVRKDAENYVLAYCGGRMIPVLKENPFGKAILYGKKGEKADD